MQLRSVLFAIALAVLPAMAQMPDSPKGYLTDVISAIPDGEAKIIERRCADLDQRHVAQIGIVVIQSLNGEPIEKVALTLFRKWGIGRKGINDGLLLVLVIGDRRTRLEVGYGLERVITDQFASEVLRSIRPQLRSGQYGQAIDHALDSLSIKLTSAHAPSLRHHS